MPRLGPNLSFGDQTLQARSPTRRGGGQPVVTADLGLSALGIAARQAAADGPEPA